jgi:hypothetical protein
MPVLLREDDRKHRVTAPFAFERDVVPMGIAKIPVTVLIE